MGIINFFRRMKKRNDEYEEIEDVKESYNEDIDYDYEENYIEMNSKIEEKEIEIEEIKERVILTKEEIDKIISTEILKIIDIYDDFNKVKLAARDSARKIGRENLNEIPKFLNSKFHRPTKYIDKYIDDSYWAVVVENSILMIIYSYGQDAVEILQMIAQKNHNLNLKATNLLCKLASEEIQTDRIINWTMNNLVEFNDENKIKILGFMSQIKDNNQVIGLIQHFYKTFAKNGEVELAYKTLNHLINAAERFTNGHLKFLKELALNKGIMNLEEVMTLDEDDPKIINLNNIDEKLSIEAAITYYSLDKNDDEINDKLYYLSEYSLDRNLRETIKNLINE